jgi:hypothetical protein
VRLRAEISFEKETVAEALEAAKSIKFGVTITDTQDSKTYSVEEFERRFQNWEGAWSEGRRMSVRAWRILGVALMGVAVLIFFVQWFVWGTLGVYGEVAAVIVAVGFALNVYSLVKEK